MKLKDAFNEGKKKAHKQSTINRILMIMRVKNPSQQVKQEIADLMNANGITYDDIRSAISELGDKEREGR